MTGPRTYVPRDAAALSVGAEAVAQAVMDARPDARLTRTGTRGMLWLEPLLEIEIEGTRIGFGPVRAADVNSILAQGVDHPLCLGPVEDIPYLKSQQRLTFARCGVTDPLSLEDYKAHGGLQGLAKALAMTPKAVVAEVTQSGLRGRGGAGFPTGIKWNTVLQAEASQKYIVCNADEGDSGTFADRILMEGDPFLLIEGMVIAGLAVGATKGYIYLRSEYPHAFRTLIQAIETARAVGVLGEDVMASGRAFDMEVRLGAGAYICGEETSLLESLEGKRGQVRFKPPLPAIEGLFGKPTIINNVLSLAAVPTILAEGAEHYRDFGTGRSRGTMPVQLGGNVMRGGLIERAFGLSLREIVEDYGGGTLTGRPVHAAQVGGPLGAYWPTDLFDTPLDYEAFAAKGGMVGHGGVVVFDDTIDMAAQARFAFEFCAIESCGKCTPCRIGSTRGAETMDRVIAGDGAALGLVRDLCAVMQDGSLCALGGLTHMPVLSALDHFPDHFPGAARDAAE